MDIEFARRVKMEWEMEQISMNMNENNNIYAQLTELQNQNQQLLERITRAETKIENMTNGGSSGSLINVEDIINDPQEFAERFFLTFMPRTDNIIYDKQYNVYVPQQIGLYVNYNGPETSQQFISLNHLRDFITDINKSEFVNVDVYVLTKTQYISKENFVDFSHDEPITQLELTEDDENVSIIDINNLSNEQILINLNQNIDENIYDWLYFELCIEIKIIDELTQEETTNKYYVDFKRTNFRVSNVADYDPESNTDNEQNNDEHNNVPDVHYDDSSDYDSSDYDSSDYDSYFEYIDDSYEIDNSSHDPRQHESTHDDKLDDNKHDSIIKI